MKRHISLEEVVKNQYPNFILRQTPLLFWALLSLICISAATAQENNPSSTRIGSAAKEKVIYNFMNSPDANYPKSGLISDGAGNFYGAAGGGPYSWGTVYELSPRSGGGWKGTVLHSFQDNDPYGYIPIAIILDGSGNIYGSAELGGTYGLGTIFELSPQAGGSWAVKNLYSFGSKPGDGSNPDSIILDNVGHIYGATLGDIDDCNSIDGTCGTVFKLSEQNGDWTESVLYSFQSLNDGIDPIGLTVDSAENIYGITAAGGVSGSCDFNGGKGCGTVFELSPQSGGAWQENLIYKFPKDGSQGIFPSGGPVLDPNGNLYGTTSEGGVGCTTMCEGTTFELSPVNGKWIHKVLHTFQTQSTDGYAPYGAVTLDEAGDLFSTTMYGGGGQCVDFVNPSLPSANVVGCGIVYELSRMAGKGWVENILHSFKYSPHDGARPLAGITFGPHGNIYGTTNEGGDYTCGDGYNCGTVFELKW